MKNNTYDMVVIGGGISGLSFAYYVSKQGKKVFLLEKNSNLGGTINSHHFRDFFIELGAHTCYNSYETLLQLTNKLNLLSHIRKRAKVPYKFLRNTTLESIRKQLHWIELFTCLPNAFFYSKKHKSVKEYYTKILGFTNYHSFAKKFFRAVICQNPDDYPAEFFLKMRRKKDKNYPRSFSFSNGLSQLIFRMKASIEHACEGEVINITLKKDGYEIKIATGEHLFAKNLAVATPPQIAANLLTNAHSALSKLLSTIKPKEVISIGVIVKKEDVLLPPVAGIIPNDSSFFSMVSRDVIPNADYRGFSFHFDSQSFTKENLEELIAEVLQVKKDNFLQKKIAHTSLPALRKNHQRLVTEIDLQLSQSPNLYLVGNYFTGVSIEDCLLRSKKELNRMIARDKP